MAQEAVVFAEEGLGRVEVALLQLVEGHDLGLLGVLH